jgi:UDP-N-acetylmuramate--alanine ligase
MSALEPGARVHVIGVGGAGMSGLARLLVEMGCVVSGSDARDSDVLAELGRAGVDVHVGHREDQGVDAQVVLWSPAVGADNVELAAASSRRATLLSRAEALAQLGARQPVIGLTGTHGKTTATSMMVHVRRAAGWDDSRLLGAPLPGVGANGHFGPDALILEVDESFGTFARLEPWALGVLNVEPDHLDHYGTLDALEEAFARLVERTSGPVVVWRDDAGARRVAVASGREVVEVGSRAPARWLVADTSLSRRRATFTLRDADRELALSLGVTGAHNVANAAVVAVLALELGAGADAVRRGLAGFAGVPGRFEHLGRWRGADVYRDYAHLPGEIVATLAAARAAGYGHVTAVFQPHRVTRTQRLADSFASAFSDAQDVIVTDIYRAGEPNPEHLTGELVARALASRSPRPRSVYAATFSDVARALSSRAATSDLIILLGAGDIADVTRQLAGGLE